MRGCLPAQNSRNPEIPGGNWCAKRQQTDSLACIASRRSLRYSVCMHLTDLQNDYCFALRQASRHISKLYERHLTEAGITPTQFSILRTLGRCSSLTMAELAKAMVMDRTTLVRALQPLFRRGFVAAPAEGQSNRRLRVVLTSRGSTKLDEAVAHWATAQAGFERSFGLQQAAHLQSELFRMTSELSDR